MKILCLIFVFACASITCKAQDSAAYDACSDVASTQTAMNHCASEEAHRVDDDLQHAYTKLLLTVAKDVTATTKIKVAERLWLSYRRAYLQAKYPKADKQGEYGSIFPMEFDLEYASITRQHIAELTDLLKVYEAHSTTR